MSAIPEFKIFLLITNFLLISFVLGGSRCPPRTDIHPCICIDRPIGKKKVETTLICHNLANGDSLGAIDPALQKMNIDKFLLYDSFWQNGLRSQDQRVPVNFISSNKILELHVVDTVMANFGCPQEFNCRTNVLKRFTSINSTMSDRTIDCSNNGLTVNFWISCPGNIEYLEINNGLPSDFPLKPEFFPEPMSELKYLILRENKIGRIDRKTFTSTKFPVLHTLDLSHNSLRDVRSIFSTTLKIKHLDLSHNAIRSLDFTNLPHLQTLNLTSNSFQHMLANDWQNIPKTLRQLDMSGNSINCGCGFKWVNSSFHINSNLIGSCASPAQVTNMNLRRASRLLNERCDDLGNILPSKLKAHAKASNQGT